MNEVSDQKPNDLQQGSATTVSNPQISPQIQQPQVSTQSQPNPGNLDSGQKNAPQPSKKSNPNSAIGIASILLMVVILAGLAIFFSSGNGKIVSSNTTTLTTSLSTVNTTLSTTVSVMRATLNNCTTISTPGQYTLGSNIFVSKPGNCIIIKTSNVELTGQGTEIHGAGPYVAVPPFTYGVNVDNANNVIISGLKISNFSFGIFVNNSNNVQVLNNNASYDVVSGIYILNSLHDTINDNIVSFIQGSGGAVQLNNSYNVTLRNNIVKTNAQIGIFINGTKNLFYNNTVINNPVDLSCNPLAGTSNTNIFSSTICSTNLECDFLKCSLNNIPVNLSSIRLSKVISSCGGIYSPGNYSLGSNLYATNYVNTSSVNGASETCITILAPQVNLNCDGHTIANAGTGISINNIYDNVTDCVLQNNTYGISSSGQINIDVHKVSISKGKYGIYLNQITGGHIGNVTVSQEDYGIYLYNSTGLEFSSLNATANTYGAGILKNPENNFKNSNLFGNSKEDLFCDANTYSSTSAIFQSSACGITDCNWASSSCSTLVLPPLANIPINACSPVISPGNYTLQSDLLQSSTCINIESNNVNLNCNNKLILGVHSGNGIQVNGRNNVSISNCDISKFFNGVEINGSSNVRLSNMLETGDNQGMSISASKNISVNQSKEYNLTGNYGMLLSGITNSNINNVSLQSGNPSTYGFLINNSYNNTLKFDNVNFSGSYGFTLLNSTMNTIVNDTSGKSNKYDFYCSGTSTGIYSEKGTGINAGVTKYRCPWLVEVNQFQTSQCFPVQKSSTVTLTSDLVYPYGSTCYTISGIKANDSIVNCNHHTVIATNGGSFLSVFNSSNIEIENCYLKNFTNAISYIGGGLTLSGTINNNTIATSAKAIYSKKTFNLNVYNNTIYNASSYGVYYADGQAGSIGKNKVSQSYSCIYLSNGTEDNVNNNLCNIVSTGITLFNNTQPTFKNNTVLGATTSSFACGIHSNTTSSFAQDLGGNICPSGNNNCLWMTNSPQCKPS